MLGVISCPKCKHVCGVDLKHKSKKCARCNYTMNISKVRICAKTNQSNDLAELIKNSSWPKINKEHFFSTCCFERWSNFVLISLRWFELIQFCRIYIKNGI